MKLYAKYLYPKNGRSVDIEHINKYLKVNSTYEVSDVMMGQSSTSIRLVSFPTYFNSVHFDFYDEDGNEVNIYRMPEYNPYI